MKYDVSKPTSPKMPALGKGTECIKLLLSQVSKGIQEPMVPMHCSHRSQKAYKNPWFRCFSPFLAHTSAAQNFSIPTAVGRNFAVKWPILWPKVVVTRVKCHYWLRLFSSPPKLGGEPDRAGWSEQALRPLNKR